MHTDGLRYVLSFHSGCTELHPQPQPHAHPRRQHNGLFFLILLLHLFHHYFILLNKKLTHIRNRLVAYLPTQPTDRPNHHQTNHHTPLRPTQHLYLDRNQSAVRYISGTQRGKFHAEAPVTQRVSVFRGDRTPCMMPGYTGHVPGQQDYHIGTKILSRVFYFKLYKKNAPSLLHLKAAGLRTDC